MDKPQWAKCILYNNDKILLVIEKGEEIWNLPGGGVGDKNNPKDVVKEKIKENLGVSLDNIDGVGEWDTDYRGTEEEIYYFKSKINKDEVEIGSKRIDGIKWFSIDDLPFLLSKSAKKGLELYKESS